MVSPDDTFLAEEVVLRSVEVQQLLLSRYGISDMSLVVCDPWYYGDRYGASHLPAPSLRFGCMSGWLQPCYHIAEGPAKPCMGSSPHTMP